MLITDLFFLNLRVCKRNVKTGNSFSFAGTFPQRNFVSRDYSVLSVIADNTFTLTVGLIHLRHRFERVRLVCFSLLHEAAGRCVWWRNVLLRTVCHVLLRTTCFCGKEKRASRKPAFHSIKRSTLKGLRVSHYDLTCSTYFSSSTEKGIRLWDRFFLSFPPFLENGRLLRNRCALRGWTSFYTEPNLFSRKWKQQHQQQEQFESIFRLEAVCRPGPLLLPRFTHKSAGNTITRVGSFVSTSDDGDKANGRSLQSVFFFFDGDT